MSSKARLRTRQCAQTKDSRLTCACSAAGPNRWLCRRASRTRSAPTAAASGALCSSLSSSALQGHHPDAALVSFYATRQRDVVARACLKSSRSDAGGPALHTAAMRLPGGAGSILT
jgi:hypothetical protein